MPDLQQYSPQHEYDYSTTLQQQASSYSYAGMEGGPSILPPPDDNDLVLAVLSARGAAATGGTGEEEGASVLREEGGTNTMNTEPSEVPPYWSFSTTRSQLQDNRSEGSHPPPPPALLLPPSSSSTTTTTAAEQQRRSSSGSRQRSQSRSHQQQNNRYRLPSISIGQASSLDAMVAHLGRSSEESAGDQSGSSSGQQQQQQEQRAEEHQGRGREDSSSNDLVTRESEQEIIDDVDVDEEDDDDDPSKGLASGPNALPVSPPRRIRRLPHIQQHGAVHAEDAINAEDEENDENCIAQCPRGRCTCSRRSSPVPQLGPRTGGQSRPLSSSSTSPPQQVIDGGNNKGKRKRDISYIRTSSYLQPGIVFTGTQSFTTYATANSSFPPIYPNPISPSRENTGYHRRSLHPFAIAEQQQQHQQQHQNLSYPGSRHALATALSRLPGFIRDAGSNVRLASSSRSPANQQQQQQQQQQVQDGDSPWSAIAGSAIDPQMQELLGGSPSFGYASGDSIARASSTEEWEVQVSISSVDYLRGRVTGIMTALNVPNSMCGAHAVSSSIGPSSASLAGGPGSNTVTTSFEGEIIDLRNNGLWTRSSPNAAWRSVGAPEEFDEVMSWVSSASNADAVAAAEAQAEADLETAASACASTSSSLDSSLAPPILVSGNSSSCTSGPWLASNQVVDKSTDLEYWAKVDAFTSFGPLAEKEICRIAREGKWPETATQTYAQTQTQRLNHHHHHARRPDPRDYILMRWKERDFIDCDARSSGLTISGFYYLCLNRKSGALSGFYYDPLSTPHQKLELQVARTRSRAGTESDSVSDSQGGIWFGSYSVV